MTDRWGHCCIWLEADGRKTVGLENRSATVTYVAAIKSQRERAAYLRRATDYNLTALAASVDRLIGSPPARRMFRITSGLFPLYTHAVGKPVYLDVGYAREYNDRLATIGTAARQAGVRLSFHPGQFCVLNSPVEKTRLNSIEEFEHHAVIATALGYRGGNRLYYGVNSGGVDAGLPDDDFAINVHGGNASAYPDRQAKLDSWRWSWERLSVAARRLITLENDENAWSSPDILALCQRLDVRMVPDVHHHWVRTGEWLQPHSPLVRSMFETWNGTATPKFHVSTPEPAYFFPRLRDGPIDLERHRRFNYELPVRPAGVNLQRLRAHSNYIYYPGMVHYLDRWSRAGWDCMIESKAKNLASDNLWAAVQALRGRPK